MAVDTQDLTSLLTRVGRGDNAAAWELVERYGNHIRAVIRKRMHKGLRSFLDSDDFVQSVWGSLVRIGPRLSAIERPDQLVALLSRMAQNKVIDEVRRRTQTEKHKLAFQGLAGEDEAAKPITIHELGASPSQYAMARERWDRMLENEEPFARRVVELRLGGNTYVEIAAALGVNERTVRRTLGRLLKQEITELE